MPKTKLSTLYGSSLALLTDLYQLTMAYGYWKAGVAEREAVFHLFFRKNPFNGGYAIACGLATAIELLEQLRFDGGDLEYLATLQGNDGEALFDPAFLAYLGEMRWTCDVDAMPEGTLAFPHEPLVRVTGPMLQCQLVETPLLNIINFQTLIATKAARVCDAARGEPVLEFGLRRAQSIDGALSASRAAYIGGCSATSNVLAGKLYDLPVKGTHAHSWVMFYDDELESFRKYAAAMPNNCVFLVDTYDTLRGVERAIEVGVELAASGHRMAGIRLDSGDLAHLSIEARKLLDAAGFTEVAIVASNDLDEHVITSLKEQGATIGVWGVGTKLVTGYDQPALGGVYKLAAVRGDDGEWVHKIKLSEQIIKISNPGIQQVRRYTRGGVFVGDMIHDLDRGIGTEDVMIDLTDSDWQHPVPAHAAHQDLLVPVFRKGARVYQATTIAAVRDKAAAQVASLSPRTRRFVNPHLYPVGLEVGLSENKRALVAQARGGAR
jgi:nicotinate phosphoribosyltransferase